MNQMKHNHYFGVPMAHFDTFSPSRNWRKSLFALLLIMTLTGLGGKAWGQVTWGDQYNPTAYQTIGTNSHVMSFLGYNTGTVITLKGNVELTFPFLVSGNENIHIVSDGNGPHTIKYSGSFTQSFSPFINGFTFNTTNFGAGTLTIDGGSDGIIIQGNTSSNTTYVPCITNRSDGTTILINVTIQGNKCGAGGAINNDGTLTCTNCIFQNNDVGYSGGNFGGAILNNGTLSCTHCSFINNKAFVGGGICSFGKVTATNCTFTSNTASGSGGGNGGGFYQANSSTSNPSVVTSCEFSGNKANAGGAIFSSGYLRITEAGSAQTLIHNNEINSGGTGGGGIFTNGIVDMEAGKIYSNATNIPNGGGVYVAVITYAGDFRLKGSSAIYSNSASSNGGGVYVASGATFTMNGGEIYSNTATTSGGGVYVGGTDANTKGIFNMTGGTIGKDNSGTYLFNKAANGAGVYVAAYGEFTMQNAEILGNTATTSGGGVYVIANGTFSMTDSQIYGNSATTFGGGVYVAANGFLSMTDSQIYSNSAKTSGGGIYTLGSVTATSGVNKIYNNQVTNTSGTQNGGGVFIGISGVLSMTNGEIYSNTARSNGGGVYIDNNANASLTLNNTSVYSNSTTAATGAGIYKSVNAKLSITGGEFYNNSAATNGGAIYIYGGTGASATTLSGVSIGKEVNNAYLPNTAKIGGGIYINTGTVTIQKNSAKTDIKSYIIGNNTIASGSTGGGIHMAAGTLTISDTEITGNSATTSGGGIHIVTSTSVSISDSNISDNTAKTSGGGIHMAAGTTTITNSEISGNTTTTSTGTTGGGIHLGGGTLSISGTEITDNTANTSGGGIHMATGSLTITDSEISGNTATTSGGGIHMVNNASGKSLTITGSDITNNTANTSGGGIHMAAGTTTITNSEISGNTTTTSTGTTGGGIHLGGGTLSISGTEITDNTANTSGGGIHMATGSLTITDSEILGNTATTSGGGIHMVTNASGKSLTITRSEISGNAATTTGGGIHHAAGTINIIDSEITDNMATTDGGGIYKAGGNIYVSGVVVVNNNLKGSAANNLYINNAATLFIYIATAGLECGSCIGITTAVPYATSGNTTNTVKIVEGQGSGTVPTTNCAKAYRNRFFFDDTDVSGVTNYNNSPYSGTNTKYLYFVKKTSANNYNLATATNSWLYNADATGCTIDGNGFVTAVNNAAGMAYFAKQILDGKDYSNKTVSLTANIDLSGHNWEPIGYTAECLGNAAYFNGTFNGQGHSVSNITSSFPYDYMGLFGLVGEDGVVKNTVVANVNFTGTNTHTGAVAGLLNGAAYNCSAITLSGTGATAASLVGAIGEEGSVKNCLVNTSATNGFADVNEGAVENCYMRGATAFVGSGSTGSVDYCYAPSGSVSGTNSVYGATALVNGKYGFAHSDQQITDNSENSYITNGAIDNRGELKGLLTTLNNWVRASGNGWNAGTQSNSNGYALWTRTMASPINGDYPVLMMPGTVCVGSPDGTLLDYAADINTLLEASAYSSAGDIYLYATNPTALDGTSGTTRVYINEHVGVLQTAGTTLNARVGVTLDNSSTGYMSYDWHMFSSALTAAPMGLEYHSGVNDTYYVKDNYSSLLSGGIPHSIYTSVANMDPTKTTWSTSSIGYFPTNTPYGKWRGTDDPNGCFDFYCYSEPYCHWINFKREGVTSFYDHWHQDADDNDNHLNIPYENELTMTQGKGYLVDLSAPSMLMADGVLNNGDASGNVSVNVTATDINFTGYEYALKGVNLIGNPYQSYLDFSEFNTTNSINTYFILDADSHGYVSYTVGQSDPVAPAMLHPHQGFFVRVSGSRSLQFTPSMRATTGDNFRSDTPHYPLVNLVCTDSQGRNDFATVELDRPEAGGGEKVSGLHAGDASIWLHLDDLEWQTAFTLPGVHEVPVRFRAYNDGMFTLGWETKNSDFSYMHLIDNLTGMDIDCLNASEYHFEGKTTDYWSRFRLVFEYTDVDENEEDGPSTGSGSFAFFMGDELVVNGPSTPSTGSAALLQLFDINGHCVFSTELYDTQSVVSPPKVAPGIYILRLTGNQVTRTQKMVINK